MSSTLRSLQSSGASFVLEASGVPARFAVPASIVEASSRDLKELRPDVTLERRLVPERKPVAPAPAPEPAAELMTAAAAASVAELAVAAAQVPCVICYCRI